MADKKWLIALLVLILCFSFLPAKKKKAKEEALPPLPPRYLKWLREEVVYIISPMEKKVFLQLQTDRERDAFMEAFWKQRDPNRNTPDNEFKTEHYRRIEYANNWFGKESPEPGWRCDMGRIYILLGEPKTIDKYENDSQIYPTIVWFYQNMGSLGLPDSFSVVFFKKDGVGEYELYSPVKYGPQKLLINYMGDPQDYVTAYMELQTIEPRIADISMTLITGEPFTINPSLASELLVSNKIPDVPRQRLSTLYAEKFLKYKDIVEVDYTANYLESSSLVDVIRDPSGVCVVHYLIEPKKLSIEQYENRFYTQFEVYGSVTDKQGTIVHQIKDLVPIELTRDQMLKIKDKLFSFQSMFPLVPGRYQLTLLLKNTVFKEYTSFERVIEILEHPTLRISPLLLANRVAEAPPESKQVKPFQVDGIQYLPSPRNDFLVQDTIHLFFQIESLSEELKKTGILEIQVLKEAEKVMTISRQVSEFPHAPNFSLSIPLASLAPANYTLKATLLSAARVPLANQESYFYITPLPALARPWVLSRPFSGSPDIIYSSELGTQYLNLKQPQKALPLLEKAYFANPQSVPVALEYCKLLHSLKQYQKAISVAQAFAPSDQKTHFAFILGQSFQSLGQYSEALTCYRDCIIHFGTTFPVLNAVGECNLALGDREEALKAWEKSLEANPGQPEIAAQVKKLKGEKK